MASPKRITKLSFPSKMDAVTYVNELLTKYDHEGTLQLTIVIEPEGYVDCSVIPAITNSSGIFSKMTKKWQDVS